jgi:hypothetical protein
VQFSLRTAFAPSRNSKPQEAELPIINLSDADQFEDKIVSEGSYPLRIVKAERAKSKAGNPMLKIAMKIEGTAGAEAPLVNENLVIPSEGDQWYRLQMQNLSRFLVLFGVKEFNTDSDDVHELEGLTAECYLTIEEYEGKESNKLRLPKVGGRR